MSVHGRGHDWLSVVTTHLTVRGPALATGPDTDHANELGETAPMNVRPLNDRVLVKRLEEEEKTAGGIYIPDSAKEKPTRGKVIAAGTGRANDEGVRKPLDVKAGDQILFGKYAGTEIKIDGEELIIMREDDILAVIEG